MIHVEGGTFMMGSEEKVAHLHLAKICVELDQDQAYYIGVTQLNTIVISYWLFLLMTL
jgi:hypothetical protein